MCFCSCDGLNELSWTVKASPKKVKLLNPHFSARVSVTFDLLLAKRVRDNSKNSTDCSTKVKLFIQKNNFVRKLSWVRRKKGDQLIPVTWLWYSEKDGCKLPKSHVNFSWTVAGFQVIKVAWRRGNKSKPFFPSADKRDKWRRSEISVLLMCWQIWSR